MTIVQLSKRVRVYSTILTILVFGLLRSSAQEQIPLVDTTFQPDIVATQGPGNGVNGIVVQSDGRIIIGGNFTSVSGQPITNLARLFSNGQLDASFGISGTDGGVLDLAQQPDGKILVSGTFTNLQGVPRQGLGRLLTNGAVDMNFDVGPTLFATNGTAYKLALRPDGRILVGTVNGSVCRLFQLNTNGGLDSPFTQTNLFAGWWIHSLLVRTDGTVLIGGGFSIVNGFSSPGLVVLDASGNLQTNFQSNLAMNSDIFAILAQTNGGLLLGGELLHTNGSPSTVMARLDSNLQWDTNFQTSSFTPFDFFAYIRSAILQADGKIVAGGDFDQVGGYFRRYLVRLDANGKVDPCFDTDIGLGGVWGVNVVTAQSDGRILAGGSFGIAGLVPNNLVRLLPQSDCNATRVYILKEGDGITAAGTCPPGGTNFLQSSTNLFDWTDVDVETNPLLSAPIDPSASPSTFYRVKKVY